MRGNKGPMGITSCHQPWASWLESLCFALIAGSTGLERAKLQFTYYIWEQGSQSYDIPENDLEACRLYPDVPLESPTAYFERLQSFGI